MSERIFYSIINLAIVVAIIYGLTKCDYKSSVKKCINGVIHRKYNNDFYWTSIKSDCQEIKHKPTGETKCK